MNQKILMSLYFLYALSLMLSTAGMEIFSSAIALVFLVNLSLDLKVGNKDKILTLLKWPPVSFGLLFFAMSTLSLLRSDFVQTPFIKVIGINRNILLLIGFLYVSKGVIEKLNLKHLSVFLGVSILVCFYTYFQYVTGVDLVRDHSPFLEKIDGYYRAIGFFAIPLTYAYIFGMIYFLILPLFMTSNFNNYSKIFRSTYYLSLLCIPLSILATGSRGAWLAAALTGALYVIMARSKKILILAGVAGVLLVTVVCANPSMRHRVTSIFDTSHTSNSARFRIWAANFEIFKDYPVLGVGPNQNDFMVAEYYQKFDLEPPSMLPPNHHAHSDTVQVLAGGGAVGLFSYLIMCLSFLWICFYAWMKTPREEGFVKNLALGCFLAQVFFHFGGLTQCNYIDREVNHMLLVVWFISAILFLKCKPAYWFWKYT